MKKRTILIFVLLVVFSLLLAACGSAPATKSVSPNTNDSAAMDQTSASASSAMVDSSASQGIGFCNNAFFPLRDDKTWSYTITSGDTTTDYSMTFKDISDSSFTAVQIYPTLTSEVTWQCDADGLISSTFSNLAFESNTDVEYKTLNVSGVALPAENEWQIGKGWDTDFTVQVVFTSGDNQIQADGQITFTRQIAAIESVSVPAGTYPEAYRVDSIGQMVLTVMGTQNTTPLTFSDWYVKGVGLVKSSSSSDNIPYKMELTSFK